MTALHAVDEGVAGAPAVVLLASLGTTTAMWEPQAAALAGRFRVVRLDLPGHGGSATEPVPVEIGDIAERVLASLDALGIARASFAGVSLGAMVAMLLAARRPARVDGLVVVCSSARLGTREYWFDRAATVRARGMAAIADAVIERWFTADFRANRAAEYASYHDMLCGVDPAGYAACCEAIGCMDLRDELAGVRARTLVVAGAADEATPPEHGREIAERIAGARLEVVADAAHLANVEQPGAVLDLMLGHLTHEGA